MNWIPSPLVLAQLSHIGWGWALSLSLSLFIKPKWAISILIIAGIVKEFYLDIFVIENDSWGFDNGSALDFCTFLFGIGCGYLVYRYFLKKKKASSN